MIQIFEVHDMCENNHITLSLISEYLPLKFFFLCCDVIETLILLLVFEVHKKYNYYKINH